MRRQAKIVATIGPSSSSVEMLEKLILAGLNVARINMSHGTHAGHKETIKNIREASRKVEREVAILCDLQGPKIRVDKLKENLHLKKDEIWGIGPSSVQDKYPSYQNNFIPTIYEDLVKDAHVGAKILFDDGLIEAVATEKDQDVLKIKIVVGGELKSNKGINLPDVNVSAPSFTEKDKEDLHFGLENDVDYIALSFVRTKNDILEVKKILKSLGSDIPIISKIEKPEAIKNIESIIDVSDCIMIARGDMGVEVGNHLVPLIQKRIINLCNEVGRPVITATQMLESMIENSRPTRAEASDVANAIWDGTDAVMLSAETASGKYPLQALTMMGQIILEAEKKPKERPFLRNMSLGGLTPALQVAASLIAERIKARWILSITQSGYSCLAMSRFRTKKEVLGVSNSIKVIRKMCLYWGITPYYFDTTDEDLSHLYEIMISELKDKKLLEVGDSVVVTHGGGELFKQGSSNSIKVEVIKDI